MDLELQKALYELFKSNLKFPFYDGLGNEIFIQIDLFSAYNGQKEVKEMANSVINLFSDVVLVRSGQVAYLTEWFKRIQREDDIYHGILELTFEIY